MRKFWRVAPIAVAIFLAIVLIPVDGTSAAEAVKGAVTPEKVKPLASEKQPKIKPEVPAGDFRNPPGAGGVPATDVEAVEKASQSANVSGRELSAIAARSNPVRRSENSNTYRAPDGSLIEELHLGKVNGKDAKGNWQKLDSRLVKSGNRVKTTFSEVDTSFAAKMDGSETLSLKSGGASLSMTPKGAKKGVAGKHQDNFITYPQALDGGDLTYEASARHMSKRRSR